MATDIAYWISLHFYHYSLPAFLVPIQTKNHMKMLITV